MECATNLEVPDGEVGQHCQWSRTYRQPAPYQPLDDVVSAPITLRCVCGESCWPSNDGSDPCEELGCLNTGSDFCRPRAAKPAVAAGRSWLLSVYVDATGKLDVSDNTYHPNRYYEYILLVSVCTLVISLLCLCVCLCISCRKLRARDKSVRGLVRSKARLAMQVAQSRSVLRMPFAPLARARRAPRSSTRQHVAAIRVPQQDVEVVVGTPEVAARLGREGRGAAVLQGTSLPMWDVMYIEGEADAEDQDEGEGLA
jgi:hypothetical protein